MSFDDKNLDVNLRDVILETQLRQALQRQAPPAGFAERVIRQTRPAQSRRRLLWPATALAGVAALVLSISIQRQAAVHEKLREEQAARQTIQALQIVAEELNTARNTVLDQQTLDQ
jgi:hypothetical protein